MFARTLIQLWHKSLDVITLNQKLLQVINLTDGVPTLSFRAVKSVSSPSRGKWQSTFVVGAIKVIHSGLLGRIAIPAISNGPNVLDYIMYRCAFEPVEVKKASFLNLIINYRLL